MARKAYSVKMSLKFQTDGCELRLGDFKESLDDVTNVDLILTSPPYNIGSKHPMKLTNRRNGGYDSKSWGSIEGYPDALPEDQYQEQQKELLEWCLHRLSPDGVIIYNHKVRHKCGRMILPEKWILPLESEGKLIIRDQVVWDHGSTHNHCPAYVCVQSERLYVLCRPGAKPYFRNLDFYWKKSPLKDVGDVWLILPDRKNKHNAPFPECLARQCIRMWSRPGSLVVDPYSGSGTTMLACIREDRKFVGSEMQKKYFDQSVVRIMGREQNG